MPTLNTQETKILGQPILSVFNLIFYCGWWESCKVFWVSWQLFTWLVTESVQWVRISDDRAIQTFWTFDQSDGDWLHDQPHDRSKDRLQYQLHEKSIDQDHHCDRDQKVNSKLWCQDSFALLWCFWNLKLISHGRSQYWLLGFWVHGLHWEMLSEYLCIGKRTFFGLSMRMPMYMVAPFNNNKHTSRFKIRRQRQFEMLRLSKLVPDYQS